MTQEITTFCLFPSKIEYNCNKILMNLEVFSKQNPLNLAIQGIMFTTMDSVTGMKCKFEVCTWHAKQNKISCFEMLIESLKNTPKYTH